MGRDDHGGVGVGERVVEAVRAVAQLGELGDEVVETAPLVVDFRGVTRGITAENLVRL